MIKNNLLYIIILFTVFSCSKNNNLTIEGKWVIDNIEIDNFDLPNNCNGIIVGDKFNFELGVLQVIKGNLRCSNYSYNLRDKQLEFLVSDMSFTMKIILLDQNKLELTFKKLPKEMMINWKEEYLKFKRDGFTISLIKIKQSTN